MAKTDITKPTDLAAVQAALAQGDGLSAAKLVGSAAAQVAVINPIAQGSSTALLKWKKARSRNQSAEKYRPLIADIGDSKTAGVATGFGADFGQFRFASSRPAQLAYVLSQRGLPAIAESMWGDAGTGLVPPTQYDPRRSNAVSWTQAGGAGGDGGIGGTMATTTSTNPYTFAPSIFVDRARIFFKQGEGNANTATASVSVDGGASIATLPGGSSPSYTKGSAINLGTLASHAINVTPAGGSPFYLAGMIAWDSTRPSVDIANIAVSGVKASWQATSQRLNWLGVLAPDLSIINIGSNDMIANGPTNVTAFTASVQATITKAKISGDVIIVFPAIGRDPGNSSQAVLVTDEQRAPFYTALLNLAITNDCVFVDEQALFGGRDVAQALGVFADSLHENYWSTLTRANNLASILLA